MRKPTFTAAILITTITLTRSAVAADAPASDPRVVAVRQAAQVPTLIRMQRSVALSSLTAEAKAKVIALVDPQLVKQQKLIDDVKAHPENSEKDTADAAASQKEFLTALMNAVPAEDQAKLTASAKVVAGEALLFNAGWPLAGHPDPLPDLVKSVGLTDAQVESFKKIREETAKAHDALVDEQTDAVMAANGKEVDSALWTHEIASLGTTAAVKFVATLDADQKVKWTAAMNATFPLTRGH